MTNTATAIFQVTLPNGTLATKRAGKLAPEYALCREDEVVSWHVTQARALGALARRIAAGERDLSVERVRLA